MPAGHQDTKHIPKHDGASGNLPKIGNNAPGVRQGGTRPTSKPNTTGGVFVPKSASGLGAPSMTSSLATGNRYMEPHNPY